MQSDCAMWAAYAISEQLRSGVSPENMRVKSVGQALAALMDFSRMPVRGTWKLPTEAETSFMGYIFEQSTGQLPSEVWDVVWEHSKAVDSALGSASWEEMQALPDPVWRYVRAVTGMSRKEWDQFPDHCGRMLKEPVQCPECFHIEVMQRFGKPRQVSNPMEFEGRFESLMFACPLCGTAIVFDTGTKDSEQYRPTLMERSKLYRWAVIAFFAAVAVSLLIVTLYPFLRY